jgi:hypothetical protein
LGRLLTPCKRRVSALLQTVPYRARADSLTAASAPPTQRPPFVNVSSEPPFRSLTPMEANRNRSWYRRIERCWQISSLGFSLSHFCSISIVSFLMFLFYSASFLVLFS